MKISELISRLEYLREIFGDSQVKYEAFCKIDGSRFIQARYCNLYTDERLPEEERSFVVLQ